MLRRWLILTALATAVFMGVWIGVSGILSHPRSQRVAQPGPLVMVSMPGLSWDQISPTSTPNLWAIASKGAVAALTARTLGAHSCPNEAWPTFSAGVRTSMDAPVTSIKAPPGLTPTPTGAKPPTCGRPFYPQMYGNQGVFSNWFTWRNNTLHRTDPADLGRLGSTLAQAGQCISAAGGDSGIGAANRGGMVQHYSRSVVNVDLTQCPVTMIGLPGLDDAYLGRLLHRLPKNATLLVVGLSDDQQAEHLRAAILFGPKVPHGLMTSESTRQPGLLQTTDLSALVLSRAGPEAGFLPEGRVPLVQQTDSITGPIQHVRGLGDALAIEHPLVGPFQVWFLACIVFLIAAVGAACLLLTRAGRRIPRWAGAWFSVLSAAAAAMPVSTFLVSMFPWWRAGHPAAVMMGGIIGWSLLIGALAVIGPWRRWVAGPIAFVAAVTAAVIAQDVVHGSHLQLISILGLQPVYGGRYFGLGNVAYALFATSALLVAALLAGRCLKRGSRVLATLTVVIIGMAAAIVDGYPGWGADGGGPLAMIPAFAYLALNAAGLALTWRRITAIVGGTFVVVAGLAVLDYLRPEQYRTHLGDFVASVLHGGELGPLQQIWKQNLRMLTSHWYTWAVPVLLIVIIVVLLRPQDIGRPAQRMFDRVRFLGHGVAAITVCWLLAFFSNDSGTGIPPSGMLVLFPLMFLLAIRIWQRTRTTPAVPPPADRTSRSSAPRPDPGSTRPGTLGPARPASTGPTTADREGTDRSRPRR